MSVSGWDGCVCICERDTERLCTCEREREKRERKRESVCACVHLYACAWTSACNKLKPQPWKTGVTGASKNPIEQTGDLTLNLYTTGTCSASCTCNRLACNANTHQQQTLFICKSTSSRRYGRTPILDTFFSIISLHGRLILFTFSDRALKKICFHVTTSSPPHLRRE